LADPMRVELVSPERVLFSGEATQVITRVLGSGEIAFLSGHAPYLGALTENHTRVWLTDGTVLDVAVHGGFVQVSNNTVSILSDVAELGHHVDRARAVDARTRAESDLHRAEDDVAEAEAKAAMARANARLLASGGIPAGSAGNLTN
jgi:F-type H+-transporting ATPase subunit epsilon